MTSSAATHSPLGAFVVPSGSTGNLARFRLWAPSAKTVALQLVSREGPSEQVERSLAMTRGEAGVFAIEVEGCPAGSLYRFQLNDGPGRPDPRSRFQPFGVHGPSQLVDGKFDWTDNHYRGIAKRDLVVYEMHIGSFTPAGTYLAAIEKLDELVELGITAIEVLPLAQCPGRWNWGYDGVNYFAPNHNFGSPAELKQFVDACHARSLAVINDVVYNHVGPEGNYLAEFGPYRSKKFGTPWGDAFDFNRPEVRQFVIDNVLFWIDEYHLDGLRLDAVHYMFDDQPEHILDEIQQSFRQRASQSTRQLHLIGESNIYDADLVGDVTNGTGHFDAIWSDCLMHSLYRHGEPTIRLTNRQYEPTDINEALEHAYVFSAPEAVRVTPEIRAKNHGLTDGESIQDRGYVESLVMALQTHDSVGNHPHGKRLHQLTSLEYQLAAAPLVLLYGSIPMIFMGEEWSTDATFPFFADFEDQGLRKAVDRGRRDEYPHHDWKDSPLPSDPAAFLNTKFNGGEQTHLRNQRTNRWYRELLKLRRAGVAEGWLDVRKRVVHADSANGLFQLRFPHQHGELLVCSRLAREASDPFELTGVRFSQLLLDSRGDLDSHQELKSGSMRLHPEHCVIGIVD